MNILLLGPQGSGKGTQAKRIAAEYGIPHIATGDILREAIAEETPLGLRVKPILDGGHLVPDDLMILLIRGRLGEPDASEGFILDGFPRTMAQADALDAMFEEIARELDIVFELQLDDESAVRRLLRRAAEEGRSRRHAGRHRQAARDLPRADGAARRPLPRQGQPGRHPRGPYHQRGVRRDPGRARAGRGVIIRKSSAELERMARAGRLVSETHQLLAEHIHGGVTTAELDRLAEEFIESRGGYPTFKGYRGYPAAICTSPNDMIVHGIPGPYRLSDGDILSVDIGVTLDGFIGDAAYTFAVGEISQAAARLLATGQEALTAGIAECRPGRRLSDVSHAVQEVTEAAGFTVVRALVGHGVGRAMHEDPQIPNYGPPGRGPELRPGMVFAIEPMITAGTYEIYLHDDDWSISTVDGSLAAHFEHTVAITEGDPRILTWPHPSVAAPLVRHAGANS